MALIVAFAAWERRARSPMLPMSFFRNVPYVSANAAGFTMTAAMMSGVVFFVQYLQASLGESPQKLVRCAGAPGRLRQRRRRVGLLAEEPQQLARRTALGLELDAVRRR